MYGKKIKDYESIEETQNIKSSYDDGEFGMETEQKKSYKTLIIAIFVIVFFFGLIAYLFMTKIKSPNSQTNQQVQSSQQNPQIPQNLVAQTPTNSQNQQNNQTSQQNQPPQQSQNFQQNQPVPQIQSSQQNQTAQQNQPAQQIQSSQSLRTQLGKTRSQLTETQITHTIVQAANYCHTHGMELSFTSPGWMEPKNLENMNLVPPTCGACLSNMAIAPNGDIIPCQSWLNKADVLGNILSSDWKDVWNNHNCVAIRDYASQDLGKCPFRETHVMNGVS